MRLYDETEEVYVEDIGNDFQSVQEYLANHWIDVPDEDEDGDMYDNVMNVKTIKELRNYADGLGYSIDEEQWLPAIRRG